MRRKVPYFNAVEVKNRPTIPGVCFSFFNVLGTPIKGVGDKTETTCFPNLVDNPLGIIVIRINQLIDSKGQVMIVLAVDFRTDQQNDIIINCFFGKPGQGLMITNNHITQPCSGRIGGNLPEITTAVGETTVNMNITRIRKHNVRAASALAPYASTCSRFSG